VKHGVRKFSHNCSTYVRREKTLPRRTVEGHGDAERERHQKLFHLSSSRPQRQLIFSRHPQESVKSHYPTFEIKPITELEQRLRRPDFVIESYVKYIDVCGTRQIKSPGLAIDGNDRVGALEADAANIPSQAVRVIRHDLNGIGAVGLEDPHRPGGCRFRKLYSSVSMV
jgi:hypothetical protein